MKFLVVDDSPTMHSFGYNDVVEASDGQDALAILYTEKIDFVITDWNMPNMNGLELTKAIRNDATFGNLPVLMVTTRGIKEDIVQALQAKVNNYIVKPFTPAVLKEKIQAIVPNA